MKKSLPSLLSGLALPSLLHACLALPALLALGACSGNPSLEPGDTTEVPSETPAAKGQEPTETGPQERSLPEQQKAALLANALKKARRNLEIGNWLEALREGVDALSMDPGNETARDIVARAQELLGEKRDTVLSQSQDLVLRYRVDQERDRAKAIQETEIGDAHMIEGRFDAAIEHYNRALTVLRYSPYFSSSATLVKELQAKLDQAQKTREQAMKDKVARDRKETFLAQKEQERLQRIAKETAIRNQLEDANRNFQLGRYDYTIQILERVLNEDPFNDNALALRDLAGRARHENNMVNLRRRWRESWSAVFDDLNTLDVPQEDVVVYDLERYKIVSKRETQKFSSVEEAESPEETAILAKLNGTVQPFTFASASLEDWKRYMGDITEVNFVTTTSVKELDADKTTLTNFKLPPMSVARALDIIGDKTGVRWKIANGVVHLVTDELAGGKMFLRQYNVQDIVEGVPDRPGKEPKLSSPGEEAVSEPEESEAKPTVVDAGKLTDLIRANIRPESWDAGKANIAEQRGVLLVRHTKEVHKAIEGLLTDLRHAVGIQVDVETRFLQVADNFLEDLGVDFRGLGNNSSEGIPGRGIETRSNVGFDDFGRRENINPASPGEVGTGTEPGIFYDDGNDGDILGRAEHLFDTTLGGGARGLAPSGGFTLQYAYLDDTEVELIFRAVAKQERSQEITAPRLIIYNNTRSHMSVLRQTTYIKDFEVEIAQAAAVANPVIGVVSDGTVLDVRPVVSADRRFITMELRPTVLTLTLPIPVFTTTLGVGQPITLQLPETTLQRVRTVVTMPDGGTVLLGGMKVSKKQSLDSGVPILKHIPILSFFFSRKGTSVQNSRLLILIRASIVIPAEHEPLFLPDDLEAVSGGGR